MAKIKNQTVPRTKVAPLSQAARIQEVLDDIVPFALGLDGVEESTSYGQPAVKRKGRLLFGLRSDLVTLSFMCSFEARDVLLKAHPETFFITDHYLNYPACVVNLATADKAVLRKAVVKSWEMLGAVKPKKAATNAAKPAAKTSGKTSAKTAAQRASAKAVPEAARKTASKRPSTSRR